MCGLAVSRHAAVLASCSGPRLQARDAAMLAESQRQVRLCSRGRCPARVRRGASRHMLFPQPQSALPHASHASQAHVRPLLGGLSLRQVMAGRLGVKEARGDALAAQRRALLNEMQSLRQMMQRQVRSPGSSTDGWLAFPTVAAIH